MSERMVRIETALDGHLKECGDRHTKNESNFKEVFDKLDDCTDAIHETRIETKDAFSNIWKKLAISLASLFIIVIVELVFTYMK